MAVYNEIVEKYLKQIKSRKQKSTIDTYRRRICVFVDFLENELDSIFDRDLLSLINGDVVQDFYIYLQKGRSPVTINHHVVIIRRFCKHLLCRELITDGQLNSILGIVEYVQAGNQHIDDDSGIDDADTDDVTMDNIDIDIEEDDDEANRFEAFTAEQIKMLLNSPKGYQRTRNRAIIAMLLGSGLRAFELCSLTVGSFRNMNEKGILCRRKGGAKKRQQVSAFAIKAIDEYLSTRNIMNPQEPLFPTKYGTKMTPNGLWGILKTMLDAVGLPSGVHNFRRTFVTRTEQAGGPAVARDAAGHRSINVTNRYLKPNDSDIKQAVDSLPWDDCF